MEPQLKYYQPTPLVEVSVDKNEQISRIKNIPEQLRSVDQWVGWRFQDREGPRGPRRTKVPVSIETGRFARVNDPSTWTSFERAQTRYENEHDWFDGIGFVFTRRDSFVGIDLDNCLSQNGEFSLFASRIISELTSYTEISPSGRGVKIIVKGSTNSPSRRDSRRGIEIYSSDRFFTLTGNVVGANLDISDCTKVLPDLLLKLFPSSRKLQKANISKADIAKIGVDQVLCYGTKAKNGIKLRSLLSSEEAPTTGSDSERDLSLCSILAFWAGPNPDLIDKIFRLSKRYRPKWDERHFSNGATYGEETIRRAIDHQNGKYYRWPSECYVR